jgi:hypothetical protein
MEVFLLITFFILTTYDMSKPIIKLLKSSFYDIIVRDMAIAFGYIIFGILTELKESSPIL